MKNARNFFKRIVVILLVLTLFVGCTASEKTDLIDEQAETPTKAKETTSEIVQDYEDIIKEKPVINLWYTNDELTSYLKVCAMIFSNNYDADVNIELVSSIDYIENINKETLNGNVTDLYILGTELLEKAYLAGLAAENTDLGYNSTNYPEIALKASTYKGKLIGYPLYYDTVFFLYNKDYVDAPGSFQDIIAFSESYEGDEFPGVETIVQWDVLDLFFNYCFVGKYLNLGGEYGDDSSVVDIANEKTIEALAFYKELNQILYFDADDSDSKKVLDDFAAGKVLYTMGCTEHLIDIMKSGINYGICTIPDLNNEFGTRAISMNYTVVVNPYSRNKEIAHSFAKALTYEYAEDFYMSVKKLPSRRLENYPNEEWRHIAEQYETTVVLPKLMATTNYWMELEVMLNNIWRQDIDEEDIEIDTADLTEEEEITLRKQLLEEKIRNYVADEIRALEMQMKLQIN